MGTSSAERQRKRRERLKNEGKYDLYKKKQTTMKMNKRLEDRHNITDEKKLVQRRKEKERKRRYREKQKQITETTPSRPTPQTENILVPRSTLSRSLNRVKKALPNSPRRRRAVVQKLLTCFGGASQATTSHIRETDISSETKLHVIDFYQKDSVSVQAPGVKDFKIIRNNGTKEKIQRRYLMLTLQECFTQFKEDYPEDRIGLSKFCDFRPEHVCLRSETPEQVCLCIYHENVRLLLNFILSLPNSTNDFCKLIVCNVENENCMLQKCDKCKDLILFNIFFENEDENLHEFVTYKQWIKNEDNKLLRVTLRDTIEHVLYLLHSKSVAFLKHNYIKHVQSNFFDTLKTKLPYGKLVIQNDFSENYAHKRQQEIQSVYWDNSASTLYTCMIYFNVSTSDYSIKSEPYVVISDYKCHDKYAVACFNDVILDHFKLKHADVKINSIDYISDGASQHFKQKFTLCKITLNDIPMTWHFSATSHGKSCIDGIGGSIKRRVNEYIMAQNFDINVAKDFAEVAQKVCPNVNIIFVSSDVILSKTNELERLWCPEGNIISTIPGTRDAHSFQSVRPYVIKYSMTSVDSSKSIFAFKNDYNESCCNEIENHDSNHNEYNPQTFHVGAWVLVKYEESTFYGLVIDIRNEEYQIKCLELSSQGKAYKFEAERDAIWYLKSQIVRQMTKIATLINARGLYKL